MGTNTSLSLRYAYSPNGEGHTLRLRAEPWGEHTTLLASMSLEGMGRCLAVEAATTTTVFEAYVEKRRTSART